MREEDITDGIDTNIWNALCTSVETNNRETYRVLKSFVRRVMQSSIEAKTFKYFQQYIFFPANLYSFSFQKAQRAKTIEELHTYCAEDAAMTLKEIIWFDLQFYERRASSLAEKKTISQFYYLAFHGFSRLLYYIVSNSDIKQFKFSINEFEQISERLTHSYELEMHRLNREAGNEEKIKLLKDENESLELFNGYRRHVLLAIKYWIILLYDQDKLDYQTTEVLLKEISVPYLRASTAINDILLMRQQSSTGYFGWDNWDHTQRMSGKVYSPPNPYYWLAFGFMVDQIRNNRLYINLDDLSAEELENAKFLYENLKDYPNHFENNNNEMLCEKGPVSHNGNHRRWSKSD